MDDGDQTLFDMNMSGSRLEASQAGLPLGFDSAFLPDFAGVQSHDVVS